MFPVYKYPNNPNTCLQYKKILIKETYTSLSHVSIVNIFFILKPPTSNTHQTERTCSSLSHLERKRPLHKNRMALLDLQKKALLCYLLHFKLPYIKHRCYQSSA